MKGAILASEARLESIGRNEIPEIANLVETIAADVAATRAADNALDFASCLEDALASARKLVDDLSDLLQDVTGKDPRR